MGKDPAFLFYPGDWLGGTSLFTRHEKGAYIDLLMAQFHHFALGIEDIEFILNGDFHLWDKKLKNKFMGVDPDGKFFNIKLREEQVRRKEYVKSRRKNKVGDEHMIGHMKRHMTSHMETETETENINKKENKILYGENVFIGKDEYAKLEKRIGKHGLQKYIERLDNYKGINEKRFKRYSSHYSVILNWWHKDGDPVDQRDVYDRQAKEFDQKYGGQSQDFNELIKKTASSMP